MILCSLGESVQYQAIPIEEMEAKLKGKLDRSLDYLHKHFPTSLQAMDDFYTLNGEKQVEERVNLELRKAENEVVADIWTEEAQLFGAMLVDCEQKGLLSTVGSVDLPLKTVLMDDREESLARQRMEKVFLFN